MLPNLSAEPITSATASYAGSLDLIDRLFDRMDAWRHFSNYQLERRADVFFALYLVEALETKLGFPILPELVPEFPVRIGTINPTTPTEKSYKIDYVCLSSDRTKAIFVELKTEGRSRRLEQDDHLLAAQQVGLPGLLEGFCDIFRATNAKRKYFCLLEHLEKIGMLHIPVVLKEIMRGPSLVGATSASKQVKIVVAPVESLVVYVQPNAAGPGIISFHEFARVVRRRPDPLSQRFARSLEEWANVQAGERYHDEA
jgi:hypothetical protein